MAVLLAQGKWWLALQLLFLGAIYASLEECSNNVVHSVGWDDVVTYGYPNFSQLFLKERFRVISPVLVEFKAIKLQVVDGVEKNKMSHLEVSGIKVVWVTWLEELTKPLSNIIDDEDSYNFSPYTFILEGSYRIFFLCLIEWVI